MSDWPLLAAPALAFVLAAGVTHLLVRRPVPRLLDRPNARSLHQRPTPRSGGIAIALALAGAAAIGTWEPFRPLAGPVLLVAGISLLDDVRGMPALVRLAVQGLAAAWLLAMAPPPAALALPGMLWALPAAVAVFGAWLSVVWMTNLYNFMDGMDGLAASMAVFGFGTYAALGWRAGDGAFATTSLATAAAAAGFLLYNRPPARIFMGDLGAVVLGFLAAAYTLYAVRADLFPLWLGALVFAPFVADATATLARRAWRREPVWRAHRSHLYQRAALAFGSRRTLAGYALWMAACAAAALFAAGSPAAMQWALLAAAVGSGAAAPLLAGRALRETAP